MDRQKTIRLLALVFAAILVTGLHFIVGTSTHRLHVVHVLFQGLYLIPILASAVWFGLAGALPTSVVISLAYLIHIGWSWSAQPMENVQQFAMIVVYLLLGSVTGLLIDAETTERVRRLEMERRAQREAMIQAIATLSAALRCRDDYTGRHSNTVSQLAVEIGKQRGLDETRLDNLRLAALVHDVGKIGIRDDVLFKPEQLSSAERDLVNRHPSLAAEILRPIQGSGPIADIVLAHHERPDGSGYPRGLKSDQIPLESLILSVADVFSAMSDERPYKDAMSAKEALGIVKAMAGSKLDAESVRVLEQIVEKQRDV